MPEGELESTEKLPKNESGSNWEILTETMGVIKEARHLIEEAKESETRVLLQKIINRLTKQLLGLDIKPESNKISEFLSIVIELAEKDLKEEINSIQIKQLLEQIKETINLIMEIENNEDKWLSSSGVNEGGIEWFKENGYKIYENFYVKYESNLDDLDQSIEDKLARVYYKKMQTALNLAKEDIILYLKEKFKIDTIKIEQNKTGFDFDYHFIRNRSATIDKELDNKIKSVADVGLTIGDITIKKAGVAKWQYQIM